MLTKILRMTGATKLRSICGTAVAPRLALLLVAVALVAAAGPAVAEEPSAPPGAPAATQPALPAPVPAPVATAPTPGLPPQPPPADKPGFLHQLKVWWDDSLGFLDTKLKDTRGKVDDLNKKSGDATQGAAAAAQDAMKSAVEATKNAATAIVKLPSTRMMQIHERCEQAPNGGHDCETAAANGCRGKGFAGGHPLDVRTAENCDSKALQAGQVPHQGECPVETVVTRAVCQ
jgi:hypothetical protein